MRIAVVSDLHGNLTAFEAVVADLRDMSPDLILHGGDLADGGSSPAEIVDRVRAAGWPGVKGNTDEMLAVPASFEPVASAAPQFRALWSAVRDVAEAAREALDSERLAWLSALPLQQRQGYVTLLHASPASLWRAPATDASEEELVRTFEAVASPWVVYGHLHRSGIRPLPGLTLVNTGSVSLSHDGDPRAAYALISGGQATIRRVEYDVEREIRLINERRIPRGEWLAASLREAMPQMP